jgi:hypothetical protein
VSTGRLEFLTDYFYINPHRFLFILYSGKFTMNSSHLQRWIIVIVLIVHMCLLAQGVWKPDIPYQWKSVQIGGGGFVDGIIFHPNTAGVCYCRTDMGGAYRRNPETMRWEPLLDWLSYEDTNLMGVESIALDPSDPDRLYLACGTYTSPQVPNGALLRSDDRCLYSVQLTGEYTGMHVREFRTGSV